MASLLAVPVWLTSPSSRHEMTRLRRHGELLQRNLDLSRLLNLADR